MTDVGTGFENVYPVVNITFVIHVSLVKPNALSSVNWDTTSRFVELLFTLTLVMINPVALILLSRVFLTIINFCPRFRNLISIIRSCYTGRLVHSMTQAVQSPLFRSRT